MSSNVVEWSDLHEELIDFIAKRLFSNVEVIRFRSICKPWRSAVANNKRFLNRRRFLTPYNGKPCLLFPETFFRVTVSSYSNKGWLIKTQDISNFRKKLIYPLSRLAIDFSDQTLDLLKFTVSEMHQCYDVQYLKKSFRSLCDFARVVLGDNLVLAVDNNKKIWWCSSCYSDKDVWTRILDEEVEYFFDIITHKGQIYALDLKGAIWWISLSDLKIFQYGPSTPMDYYYEIDDCKDKRLVEYCGDLCVIHRFYKKFRVKRTDYHIDKTVGFRVYKMDEESVEWVEVKSLGDKAFVLATDSCFAVLAREYYGCLENSIYFTDEQEEKYVKVFKIGDGTIITMMVDSSPESCFQFLSPPFV